MKNPSRVKTQFYFHLLHRRFVLKSYVCPEDGGDNPKRLFTLLFFTVKTEANNPSETSAELHLSIRVTYPG
jgi:hypothetical protein